MLTRRNLLTGAASFLANRAFAYSEDGIADFINLFDDSYSSESEELTRHMFSAFANILRHETAATLRDSPFRYVRFRAGRWATNVAMITPTIILDCNNCGPELETLASMFDEAASGPPRINDNGSTNLVSALAFGLDCCNQPAQQRIINIYTDTAGRNTQIPDLQNFRSQAENKQVVVNGLIFGPRDALGNYFPRYVQSGEYSFTADVRDPKAFSAYVRHSLVYDIY